MVRPTRSWIWPAAAKLPLLDPVRFAVVDLAWSLRGRSGAVAPFLAGPLPVATDDLTGSDSLLKLIPTEFAPGKLRLVTINAPQADPNETGGRP
jgi:predicted RNase H-like nuclease